MGARFRDLDCEIEDRHGRSIPEIFELEGEDVFRAFERREMERALAEEPAVIAPGGGWAAQPGNLESLERGILSIYLEASAATAAERVEPGGARPLLRGGEAALGARMQALLREREPLYARCDARVPTDERSPAEIVREVVALARKRVVG